MKNSLTALSAVALLASATAFANDLPEQFRVYPTPKHVSFSGDSAPISALTAEVRRVTNIAPEGYILAIGKNTRTKFDANQPSWYFQITASTDAGERYARATFAKLCAKSLDGTVPCCRIDDSPDIPYRGLVEGFYGRPWSWEGRRKVMDFLGHYNLNTYIYGPKDDPYHHAQWREPYPEDMAKEFKALLATARDNNVNFFWAVHLGDAFTDHSPEAMEKEYAALFAKLGAMYDIGFRSFAAFFDDFGKNGADIHATICNRIKDFLDAKGDCSDLIVCPHEYVGDGANDYIRTLGANLKRGIQLMWTGPNICTDIPLFYTKAVTANGRRAPFVWWNWPVNDFNRGKLIMGRAYGVDPYPFAGFVTNPMENLEASKPALFSVADFAWNMKGFDSKRAWNDAFLELYPSCPAAMRCFADHNSDSAGGPRSEESWLAGWNRLESENFAATGDLGLECEAIRGACRKLTDTLPTADPALWSEIRNWVAMLDAQAQEGQAALRKDKAAYDAAKKLRAEIFERQKDYFTSLAPEWDKKNCTGAITGTRLLQPAIDAAAAAAFAK